ncbi:MAG: hypothetical protein J5818_06655 [Eggerthellaceae bacterium]|nr:hypothetical protein [Eggerthellaceae bacterium]
MVRCIVADRNEEVKDIAGKVLSGKTDTAEIVSRLAEGTRRERQIAAAALYLVAKEEPEKLVEHIDCLVDALNRPEAQTRWECLEALTILVDFDARSCGKALPEVESALFDEESGPVRLGAMRFLCKYGATTANRSEKVWSLIDEGIQCYHGDLEFSDMMTAVIDFSNGKLADQVKESLSSRMSFDAENGKGALQRRAQQIIDNLA